jgi:hypothetical protein
MLDITELYCSQPANATAKAPRLGAKLEVLAPAGEACGFAPRRSMGIRGCLIPPVA